MHSKNCAEGEGHVNAVQAGLVRSDWACTQKERRVIESCTRGPLGANPLPLILIVPWRAGAPEPAMAHDVQRSRRIRTCAERTRELARAPCQTANCLDVHAAAAIPLHGAMLDVGQRLAHAKSPARPASAQLCCRPRCNRLVLLHAALELPQLPLD